MQQGICDSFREQRRSVCYVDTAVWNLLCQNGKSHSVISLPTVRQVPHFTGRSDCYNLLLSPKGLVLCMPSLPCCWSVLSISSPLLPGNSHIPSVSHIAISSSTEQLLGELTSDRRDGAAPWEVLESRLNLCLLCLSSVSSGSR